MQTDGNSRFQFASPTLFVFYDEKAVPERFHVDHVVCYIMRGALTLQSADWMNWRKHWRMEPSSWSASNTDASLSNPVWQIVSFRQDKQYVEFVSIPLGCVLVVNEEQL
jgi:hypothetical protein